MSKKTKTIEAKVDVNGPCPFCHRTAASRPTTSSAPSSTKSTWIERQSHRIDQESLAVLS